MLPLLGGYEWADALRTLMLGATPEQRAHNDQYTTFLRCLFPRHFAGRRVRRDLRNALTEAHEHASPSVVDLALGLAVAVADELTADELTEFLSNIPPVDLGFEIAPLDWRATRNDLRAVLRAYEPGRHRASLLQSLVDGELLHALEHLPADRVPVAALQLFARRRDPNLRAFVARTTTDPELLRTALSPADPIVDAGLMKNAAAPEEFLLRVVARTRIVDFQQLETAAVHQHATDAVHAAVLERIDHIIDIYEGTPPDALHSIRAQVERLDRQRRAPNRGVPTTDGSRARDTPTADEVARLDEREAAELARTTSDTVLLRALADRAATSPRRGVDVLGFDSNPVLDAVAGNPATPDSALIELLTDPTAVHAVLRERRELSDELFAALAHHADVHAAEKLVRSFDLTQAAARTLLARFDSPTITMYALAPADLDARELERRLDRAMQHESGRAHEIKHILGSPGASDALRMRFIERYDPGLDEDLVAAWRVAQDSRTGAAVLEALLARTPSPGAEHQNGSPTRGTVRAAIASHDHATEAVRRELLDDPDIIVVRSAARALGDEPAFLALARRSEAEAENVVHQMMIGGVSSSDMPELTKFLLAHHNPEVATRAAVSIAGVPEPIARRALEQLSTRLDPAVSELVFNHPHATEEIRLTVIDHLWIHVAPKFIAGARTDAEWEALVGHRDPHLAMLAATDPHRPPGVGAVRTRTTATVAETALAIESGVSVPPPDRDLRWGALPNLDDVPFELAPEVHALDGRILELDGNRYHTRVLTDGGQLRDNATFMNNCTYTSWRHGIRNGTQAVLAIDDDVTGATVWNVGLTVVNGTWTLGEVNSQNNRGVPPEVARSMEALVPETCTPVEEVRATHSRRRAALHQRADRAAPRRAGAGRG